MAVVIIERINAHILLKQKNPSLANIRNKSSSKNILIDRAHKILNNIMPTNCVDRKEKPAKSYSRGDMPIDKTTKNSYSNTNL